jgi:hypothetical protein
MRVSPDNTWKSLARGVYEITDLGLQVFMKQKGKK